MKFNLRPVLLPALAFVTLFANAQKELKTVPDVKLRVGNNLFTCKSGGAIVNFENGTTVALVSDRKYKKHAVVSVTPDYRFKWTTAITGDPFCIARLGDNVIVVAATDRSYFKSYNNQYNAFLIDPASGKVLMQKEIYNGSKEFMEFPRFYTSESGKFFKFSVRRTAVKRKVHVGLPGLGALVTLKTLEKQANTVQRFAIVTIDKNFDMKTVEPAFPEGTYINSVSNADGDVFVFTMNNKSSFQVSRYPEGQTQAVSSINQPLGGELKRMLDPETGESQLFPVCDDKNPSAVYWGMMVDAGKGTTLLVSRINFADGSSSLASETFTQDKLRGLKKQFKANNEDVGRLDLGVSENMVLHSLRVFEDRVFVITAAQIGSGSFFNFSSEIVSSFSKDLKLNYQLVIPNRFYVKSPGTPYAEAELNRTGDVVRFIANADKGIAAVRSIYGEFNAETGQMLKLTVIPRGKKVSNDAFVNGKAIMWTDKSYTVSFCEPKGWTGSKEDVTVKQYAY